MLKMLILSGALVAGTVIPVQAAPPTKAGLVGMFDAWLEACKPNAPPSYRAEVLRYNNLPGSGDEIYDRQHYEAKHSMERTMAQYPTFTCNSLRSSLNEIWKINF